VKNNKILRALNNANYRRDLGGDLSRRATPSAETIVAGGHRSSAAAAAAAFYYANRPARRRVADPGGPGNGQLSPR